MNRTDEKRERAGLTWEQMEEIDRADRRRDYIEKTPGQRLKEVLQLSELSLRLYDAGERLRERGRA